MVLGSPFCVHTVLIRVPVHSSIHSSIISSHVVTFFSLLSSDLVTLCSSLSVSVFSPVCHLPLLPTPRSSPPAPPPFLPQRWTLAWPALPAHSSFPWLERSFNVCRTLLSVFIPHLSSPSGNLLVLLLLSPPLSPHSGSVFHSPFLQQRKELLLLDSPSQLLKLRPEFQKLAKHRHLYTQVGKELEPKS